MRVAITNTSRQIFNVYSKGYIVGRLSNQKYRKGGIIVLPDSWDVNHLGLGPSEEMGYLQELIDAVLVEYK